VVNAGCYAFAGLPNAAIAQGSLFVLFGTNMGPATLQGAASFPLQTTLAGTSISVTVGGTATQSLMIYTSAGQAAAVLRSNTPVGTGTLTVTYNGQTSAPLAIQVVASNLGIFTVNQGGTGAGVILDANNEVITALHPAAPNQTVVLYGTGLGPYSGDETRAAVTTDMTNIPVEVYVGTAKANVVFRGRNSCCVGLDQINFQVPPGQLGCSVAVAVKIGSNASNFTSMAVSNGGPCSDSGGISSDVLQTLSTRGNIAVGSVSLTRTALSIILPPPLPSQTTTTEVGGASFARYNATAFLQGISSFSTVSLGGCVVFTFRSGSSAATGLGTFTGLNAGAAINVSGPNGSKQLTPTAGKPGLYSAIFSGFGQPSYLTPGAYTITGPGGSDVGPFTVMITAGSPLTWTNQSSISTVNRSQDLTITWTGGTGQVLIQGASLAGPSNATFGGSFICVAPASAGQFTVPSVVLLALPPSAVTSAGTSTIPNGFLYVGSSTSSPFTASGLDQGLALYTDSSGKPVAFQ